jgi:hypothetical protein
MLNHVNLGEFGILLEQAHCTRMWPAVHAHSVQAAQQPLGVRRPTFVTSAHPCTLLDRSAKTRFARGQLFKAQSPVTKPVLVRHGTQSLERRVPTGKQTKQIRLGGKVQVAGIDHTGLKVRQLQAAQLLVSPEFLVEDRLLQLDHLRFEQQGADLPRCSDVTDSARLSQHAHLVLGSQVGQESRTEVDAFPDVQRQITLLPMKGVDPRSRRRLVDHLAQMLWADKGLTGVNVFWAASGMRHVRQTLGDQKLVT